MEQLRIWGRKLAMLVSCFIGAVLFLILPLFMLLQWVHLHTNVSYLVALATVLIFMFCVLKGAAAS